MEAWGVADGGSKRGTPEEMFAEAVAEAPIVEGDRGEGVIAKGNKLWLLEEGAFEEKRGCRGDAAVRRANDELSKARVKCIEEEGLTIGDTRGTVGEEGN